jgi:hypothetical protein
LHDKHALVPTNIAPAERYELPAPESCVRGDPQQVGELTVLLRAQWIIRATAVGSIPPNARFGRTRERLDLLDREDFEPRRAVLPALGRGGGTASCGRTSTPGSAEPSHQRTTRHQPIRVMHEQGTTTSRERRSRVSREAGRQAGDG